MQKWENAYWFNGLLLDQHHIKGEMRGSHSLQSVQGKAQHPTDNFHHVHKYSHSESVVDLPVLLFVASPV